MTKVSPKIKLVFGFKFSGFSKQPIIYHRKLLSTRPCLNQVVHIVNSECTGTQMSFIASFIVTATRVESGFSDAAVKITV